MFVGEIAVANSGGRSEIDKGGLMLSPAEIIESKKKLAIDDRRDDADGNQVFILRRRQAPKQDTVDQTEHRGSRSDAEGQREDGHRGEGWALPQLPKCVTKILKNGFHRYHS